MTKKKNGSMGTLNSVGTRDCKFKKGQVPWNKGMKGVQVSWNKGTKGIMKAWNKGKTNIYTQEAIKKIREAKLGKHQSEETKIKRGKSITLTWQNPIIRNKRITGQSKQNNGWFKKGQPSLNKGKHPSLNTIQKIKDARAKQVFPIKDTKIEVKIQNFLQQLSIEYFTHKYMNIDHSYQCDIFIPSINMVIECDGSYWHKYPIGTDIDHIRTSELIQKGFKVLRLWEQEIINMNVNTFKNILDGYEIKSNIGGL